MAKRAHITRDQALSAKPLAGRILERTAMANGGVRLRVPYSPPRYYRWLIRDPDNLFREYDLDPFGVELLELCDGQKSVRYIIDQFIKRHQLNAHEAEQAVVGFLRLLLRKGVVTMLVPK